LQQLEFCATTLADRCEYNYILL